MRNKLDLLDTGDVRLRFTSLPTLWVTEGGDKLFHASQSEEPLSLQRILTDRFAEV